MALYAGWLKFGCSLKIVGKKDKDSMDIVIILRCTTNLHAMSCQKAQIVVLMEANIGEVLMTLPVIKKPSHRDWIYTMQVVIDRLTQAVHTYKRPPFDDVFMSDREKQDKTARCVDLLRRIHGLTDDAQTPTDSLADVARHDEQIIAGLFVLAQQALDVLPVISYDMQKLMKSPWHDRWTSRIAMEMFRGPKADGSEGIGTGYPEHGRLPEVLSDLLERETVGSGREPREALHRHGADLYNQDYGGVAAPERHMEGLRRWNDRSRRASSTAGGME